MTKEDFLKLPKEQQYHIYQEYKKTNTPSTPVPAGSVPGPFEGFKNEQHPGITAGDRLKAENFATSPANQLAFYKAQHPELEFRLNGEDVQVKSPKETSWQFANPPMTSLKEEFSNPSELAKDVGGHLYNTVVGVPAQIGGEALGAMAGGIPGAIIGAGVGGAGSEGLRQIIGEQVLGIPNNMDRSQVQKSALFSAAIPGVSSAFRGAAPMILSGTSGVPKDVIKAYVSQAPVINKLISEGPAGKVQVGEEKYQQIRNLLNEERSSVGKKLETAVDSVSQPMDIAPLKQELKEHISKLSSSKLAASGVGKQEVGDAINLYEQLFGTAENEIPDVLTASEAFRLRAAFKDSADLAKIKPGVVNQRMKNVGAGDRELMNYGQSSYHKVNSYLDEATNNTTKELRDAYKGLKKRDEYFDKFFKDPDKTLNTLENLDGSKKDAIRMQLESIDKTTGTDFVKTAEQLKAAKYFKNPGLTPFSGESGTSTSRSALAAALGMGPAGYIGHELGGKFGGEVGAAAGMVAGSPAAVKAYSNAAHSFNQIPSLLRSAVPYTAEENLKNTNKNDVLKMINAIRNSSAQRETQ